MVFERAGGINRASDQAVAKHAATVNDIATFLWLPLKYAPDASPSVLSILMNCVGPMIVRKVFGPPSVAEFDGGRLVTDHGWIAEAIIMASFGQIPNLTEIIPAIFAEPQHTLETQNAR